MTSAGRFGSAARHTLPQSRYVCLQCRLRTSAATRTTNSSISITYAPRRHASWINPDDWIDTVKLRKKIWRTENPPGQKDPYVRESEFDRMTREREEANEEAKQLGSAPEKKQESTPEEKYVPATTAKGLKWVGGHGWGDAEWQTENPFQGFMEPEKTEGREGVAIAVHRALVETYALKEAGLPITMDYYSLDPTEDYATRVAEGARFEHDEDGKMALVLESEDLRQIILKCVTPQEHDDNAIEEIETEEEEFEEEEVEQAAVEKEEAESRGAEATPPEAVKEDDDSKVESEDSEQPILDEEALEPAKSLNIVAQVPASNSWRNVSLEDGAIKFAVLKRVMQLTGKRIPDPDISAISTPGSLVVHLVKQPKPEKIAEVLQKSDRIIQLPNVQILNKRYGAIDRDVEVGRWKVIKKELEKRGLPISGKYAVRNNSMSGRL